MVVVRALSPSSEFAGPPRGFFPTPREWLAQHKDNEGDQLPKLITTNPSSTIEREPPKSVSGEFHWKFQKDRLHTSPETFVVQIPDGRFWGYYGGNVITPDDMLLEDLSKDIRPGGDHEIFLQLKLPRIEKIVGTVAIISSQESERNYYHWMFDVVPKVRLLADAGITLEEIDLFATNMSGLSFQDETLALLKVPQERLRRVNGNTHLKADRLVVPSPTINSSFDTPQWTCKFLRELLLSNVEPALKERGGNPELLYITRSRSAFRHVINEGELTDFLTGLGFSTIAPEDLTVVEQAARFASARAIVSVHGAGLVNLVCSNPGTKIIELFSPNFVQTNYWGISSVMGLDYYYLFAEGEHPKPAADPLNRFDDLKVDIAKLKATLKLAGII